MENVNATIAAIITDSPKTKLADSKATLKTIAGPVMGYTNQAIKDLYMAADKERTKLKFTETLTRLGRSIQDDTAPVAGEEKALDDEEKFADLDMIATTIRLELANAQRSFLNVGKCLTQALASIKNDGGNQTDFLAWASDYCEIRKAQAYKLMKVYKTFGDESDFAGVSMRVLYALTGVDEKQLELARAMALDGNLDTKTLDGLLMASKPVKEEKLPSMQELKTPGGTPAVKGDPIKEVVKEDTTDKLVDTIIENSTPAPVKEEVPAVQPVKDVTVSVLNDTIKELNATIAALQTELADAKRTAPAAVVNLPALPQFDSPCKATCIGLEIANIGDKVKINKAYRALAKIYTTDKAPEASAKILAARTELLAAII